MPLATIQRRAHRPADERYAMDAIVATKVRKRARRPTADSSAFRLTEQAPDRRGRRLLQVVRSGRLRTVDPAAVSYPFVGEHQF
jgi:hypothetical protein